MAAGGSVVAIKYDGGVLMAADTLLSYGAMAKQPNIPRMAIMGRTTCISATGDYADFQAAYRELQSELEDAKMLEDGVSHTPKMIYSYLHRTVYGKRCDFEPWQCQFIVMGAATATEESFLGGIDSIGTKWAGDCVATGYGGHMSLPLLRAAIEKKQKATGDAKAKLTKAEAMNVLTDCMRVLFYRECRAVNRFQFAEATDGKVTISDPITLDTEWEFSGFRFEKTAIIR